VKHAKCTNPIRRLPQFPTLNYSHTSFVGVQPSGGFPATISHNPETFLGDFRVLIGDFRVLIGDFGVLIGDFGVFLGDFRVLIGDFGVLIGDFGVLIGDIGTFIGDSEISLAPGKLLSGVAL
jgi:hypothetical protein